MSSAETGQTRCGFVALLGAPNAGKSTLLNQLAGQKLAIVSPKPQTTRTRLRAIVMEGAAQLIFTDTPGIFAAKKRMERAMVGAAWGGLNDCDAALLIVDAGKHQPDEDTAVIIERIKHAAKPVWLVLNKVDTVNKNALLLVADALQKAHAFEKVFMISAKKGHGVDDLRRALAAIMPPGPYHYDPEQVTDAPQRSLAAEITREQLYLQLGQELPYATFVETEKWEQFDNGEAKVSQIIYVQRDGQKGIVIGAKGAKLKAIGEAARAEMFEAFGFKVHLFLHVKVKENWAETRSFYSDQGLDFDS